MDEGLTEPNVVSDRRLEDLNLDLQESFDQAVTLKPPLPSGGKRPPIQLKVTSKAQELID